MGQCCTPRYINSASKNEQSGENQSNTQSASAQLAALANIIFLFGDAIIVATKRPNLQVAAADIKLFGGVIAIIAAFLRAQENIQKTKLPSGVIRPLDKQTIIGGIISTVGAILLADVLRREVFDQNAVDAPTLSPFLGV